MRIGEHGVVVVRETKNGLWDFNCSHSGCDIKKCEHVIEAIGTRSDTQFLNNLVAGGSIGYSAKVNLLLLEKPNTFVPVIVENDGIYDDYQISGVKAPIGVFHPNARNGDGVKQMKDTESRAFQFLCHVSPGDGLLSIRQCLFDMFSGAFMEFRFEIRCKSGTHGMKEQARYDQKMRIRGEVKAMEMLRVYLTGKCSACTNRSDAIDLDSLIPKV